MSTPTPGPDPADQDALWREIVENYGDRPVLDQAPSPEPEPAPEVHTHEDEPVGELAELDDPDEHYLPPPPPPVSYPTGLRAVAWFGIFGGPTIMLLMLTLKIYIPSWAGWFAFFGFVGGFGYLVATMRTDAEGWDDGAEI